MVFGYHEVFHVYALPERIAGFVTITPPSPATAIFLVATHGAARVVGLIAIWTLTLTAGGINMAWMNAPERLVGGTS